VGNLSADYIGGGLFTSRHKDIRIFLGITGGVGFGHNQCVYKAAFIAPNIADKHPDAWFVYPGNKRPLGHACGRDRSRFPSKKFLVGAFIQRVFMGGQLAYVPCFYLNRMPAITIKRVYEEPSEKDGLRILVDRLWPRGLNKEKATIDLWLKDIAPSEDLRKWFGHDPGKWAEFKKRYGQELRGNRSALEALKIIVRENHRVCLLYAAKDEKHNNAAVLLKYLK